MSFRYPDKPTSSTLEFISTLQNGEWIVQEKIDGWRINIFFDEEIKILTRQGNPLSDALKGPVPEEVMWELEQLKTLKPGMMLDGEYTSRRASKAPAVYLFDVVYYNGEWQTTSPYIDRLTLLLSIVSKLNSPRYLFVPKYSFKNFGKFYKKTKKEADKDLVEGVVVKHIRSKLIYSRSRSVDNPMWFKAKWDVEK